MTIHIGPPSPLYKMASLDVVKEVDKLDIASHQLFTHRVVTRGMEVARQEKKAT